MIAEVGDIENVSGSRMATPLAPPRPAARRSCTPSMMPTNMTMRLTASNGEAMEQIDDLFHNCRYSTTA